MRSFPLAAAALLALLLTGCSPTSSADLEIEFEKIPHVDYAQVGGTEVKVGLVEGVSAADAEEAILALRDEAVERHPRGTEVVLTVVIMSEGDAPYSYGKWYSGTVDAADFEQQARFVGSLAEWEGLVQTPATVEWAKLEVYDEPPASIQIGQPLGAGNDSADIAVLRDDLARLWQASGGELTGVSLR